MGVIAVANQEGKPLFLSRKRHIGQEEYYGKQKGNEAEDSMSRHDGSFLGNVEFEQNPKYGSNRTNLGSFHKNNYLDTLMYL